MDNDDNESVSTAKSDIVAKLQTRKETLKAILDKKTLELKQLCIEEAELTGVLPAEIPLQPGESPPQFRRRVGTAFTYPENLIQDSGKSNNKEDAIIASIELELKIQSRIAEAALSLANDTSASKAVRRKHQIMYKQSLNTLQELESKLKHKQGISPTNKYQHKQRKKPRPPLEHENEKALNEVLLQSGGINLSPLVPNSEAGSLDTSPPTTHHMSLYRNAHPKYFVHELARPRSTHLHKSNSGYYFTSNPGNYINFSSPPQYLTLATCAHMEYAKLRNKEKMHQGYWKQPYSEQEENLDSLSCSEERKTNDMFSYAYSVDKETEGNFDNNSSHLQFTLLDTERFRSLNRRKVNPSTHTGSSPCLEIWTSDELDSQTSSILNHNHPVHPSLYNPSNHHYQIKVNKEENKELFVPYSPKEETLLPNQTYPEHSLGHDNRTLFRTKSLGSVETLNVQSNNDTLSRKQKEKEWFETSLDCSGPLGNDSISYRSKPKVSPDNIFETSIPENVERSSDLIKLSRSSSSASNDNRSLASNPQHQTVISSIRTNSDVPLESPKNHMVVQAGKWQPYREVTKPFEMADFYKYSTKFRKSNTQNSLNKLNSPTSYNNMTLSPNNEQNSKEIQSVGMIPSQNVHSPPVQSGPMNTIPLQLINKEIWKDMPNSNKNKAFHSINYLPRNSIHEFNMNTNESLDNTNNEDFGRRPLDLSLLTNEHEIISQKNTFDKVSPMSFHSYDVNANNNVNRQQIRKVLSPNSALEASLNLSKEESLADAFSTEMLAWYQDQNVPRSATLV